MNDNEQVYTLELVNINNRRVAKVHFEDICDLRTRKDCRSIREKLFSEVSEGTLKDEGVMLTLTNRISGVSVEREYSSYSFFKDVRYYSNEITQLVNIIMGYEEAEEVFIHD
ncbi:DUF1869 domain-containing protein [Klebsiella pneumoniae]|uniref:DUF1869 domain-containing protein n=1 Tax=Klebsiella pneumoniae TaxID=573 RepID=UPI00203ED77D|nr:DUF1869 domain-containing protein [Klebsiella pneumoniae]USB67242.1 DUF1869 domain-containing protein [Klebsiella pneumoniae]HBT4924958.1 DUF1869 domain-containing protein [Klebsiella pneumoniae]